MSDDQTGAAGVLAQHLSLPDGPEDADPASLRILRRRRTSDGWLFAVRFRRRSGLECFWLSGVLERQDGWAVTDGAGGGVGQPRSELPWLNLCGWGWPQLLRAGGRVVGAGADGAASVRLTLGDGRVLEDGLEDGVALLVADGPDATPRLVEILDPDGALLSRHPAFGGRPRQRDDGDRLRPPGQRG
jgi:hypothetical protein